MSTYKAVFSDIDGTLLTSEHIVSTATIEAIASLQDKNIPFVIISSSIVFIDRNEYNDCRSNDCKHGLTGYFLT